MLKVFVYNDDNNNKKKKKLLTKIITHCCSNGSAWIGGLWTAVSTDIRLLGVADSM